MGNAICPKTGSACQGRSESNGLAKVFNGETFKIGNWYRPESLEQLMELLRSFEGSLKYRLIAGNTGTGENFIFFANTEIPKITIIDFIICNAGVYKNDGPYDVNVDITKIADLYQISKDSPLTIGGGVNLSDMKDFLSSIGSTNSDYWYAATLAEHIGKIGSVPVRNV